MDSNGFHPHSPVPLHAHHVLQQEQQQPVASGSALPPKKKRTRVEGGKSAGASPEGEEGETARKKRLALSCSECKRRKIKCDRKQPCSSCIRRKMADSCDWDDDPNPTQSFALSSDVRHLARRLAHLESLFATANPSQPAYLPPPLISRPLLDPAPDDPRLHSDTEDAAVEAEEAAFGARVPVLRAISAAAQSGKRKNQSLRAGMELTSALTSILAEPLSFDQDGRPRSSVRLGLDLAIQTSELLGARRASMAQVFAVLPGKEISDFLLQKYFGEMSWDFNVVDAQAFIQEHERYTEMILAGRQDSIDPLWVAVFCMVIALSLEGFWNRPGGARNLSLFGGLSETELMDLPSVWHDAALRALQIGEWGGTPRIRTIQTIVLFGQYIQISSSSGQQGRFLGWAASAIRVAQRLGLHRLGSNPETMPPDDPALPPGSNSLKRETAVRLFHTLVHIDSLLSDSATFRCYLLHPSQYNTARPLNLNYSDLSRTEWRTVAPASLSVLTDASFEIAQANFAAQVRRALDELVLSSAPFSYAAVLEQDREFRRVLEDLPDLFSETGPPLGSVRLNYQRSVLHAGVHARLLRLHRPFLSRGYNPGSPFRYSTDQCIRAAGYIIATNYELLRVTSSLWWMYTATLASSIVLMMDLFHAIDTDLSEDAIKDRKDVLGKASIIFGTQVQSPALRAVVEQGRRILSDLFDAEESRRMTRAAHTLVSATGASASIESFAQVLKRISHELAEEHIPTSTSYASYASSAASPSSFAPPSTNLSLPVAYAHQPSPLSQDLSTFGYWDGVLADAPQDDYSSFFETLASEDWAATALSGSDGGGESTGLLGQMAATW